jgi:hypothetical protein
MADPTFDLSLNPGAIMPEPGVFPKRQFVKIIEACVRPLGTFRGVPVIWATDRRPVLAADSLTERAFIILSETGDAGVGCEELRSRYNEQENTREVLLVAQRQVTLNLRAISLDPDLEGASILKRVRFYINTAPARLLMVPTIALVDYTPITTYADATVKSIDGRAVLAATMGIRMAYVEAADPSEQGEQDFAETASGEGEVSI